jgi:hypothetical protein
MANPNPIAVIHDVVLHQGQVTRTFAESRFNRAQLQSGGMDMSFDVEPRELDEFVRQLQQRAVEQSWDANSHGIMEVCMSPQASHTIYKNLNRESHGISEAELRAHAATFKGRGGKWDRDDQDLYHCVRNSLSKAGRLKIDENPGDYLHEQQVCGVLLLKAVIDRSYPADYRSLQTGLMELHRCVSLIPQAEKDAFNAIVSQRFSLIGSPGHENTTPLQCIFESLDLTVERERAE